MTNYTILATLAEIPLTIFTEEISYGVIDVFLVVKVSFKNYVIVFFNVILSLVHIYVHELPYFDENWVSVLYKYPGPHDHVELFSLV